MNKRILAIGAVVAAVGAGGATWAATDTADTAVVDTLSSSNAYDPGVADPAMPARLQGLLPRVDRRAVPSASLGKSRPGYGPGQFVETQVAPIDASDAQGQTGEFESALLAADLGAAANGAVAGKVTGASGQQLHDTVPGAQVHIVRADGSVRDAVTGGYVTYKGPYSSASDSVVTTYVRAAVANSGLTFESVRVRRILDVSIELTVSVDPSMKFEGLEGSLSTLVGELQKPVGGGIFEGTLVTVVREGQPVAYTFWAPRAGMGGHWFSPTLAPGASGPWASMSKG